MQERDDDDVKETNGDGIQNCAVNLLGPSY